MLTVDKIIARGHGLASVLLKRATQVELDWDVRQKSRFEATDSAGRRLAVFLPRGTAVRGGDVMVVSDGSLVRVLAAPQPVMQVRVCAAHGQPLDLLRAAYHLGNRHVPLEVQADVLQFEPDPVLADMLRRQHLIVTETHAAFEPEGGAYGDGAGHGHGHDHSHDHGHAHAHAHDEPGHACGHAHHEHGHDHGHEHVHEHGPACGHAHHTHEPHAAHGHAPALPARSGKPVGIPVKAHDGHGHEGHVHGPGCGHDH
ncbi:urease accessory protein UreE [Roseateles sp. BYS87W]|uniref:Urease accessory protein UreE n=1 Tax=Pelomonas baiyunensis TaxID=3299026 RepID=A0ABW7GWB6_9BURK